MIRLTKENHLFTQRMGDLRLMKAPEKTIVFSRKGLLFAFNFHPNKSLTNVLVPVQDRAEYTVCLCSDDKQYGGQELISHMTYPTKEFDGKQYVELYLPARTAVVLKEKKLPNPEAPAPNAPKTKKKKSCIST